MSWSSPVRVSATNLSPIPNEIYLEIFSYLRPSDPNEWIDAEARQHFCNLALVCRFFSSVMLPWIFENLKFVEKNSYSQTSSPPSTTFSAKFCRNVLDGDTTALLLAKHVKRWAFLGSPSKSKWTPAFLAMYFETFQHLPNLLELSLTNITIPKDLFKRLTNVPTLEALTLESCSFDETVQNKHLKHFESLPLKRLALVHPIANSYLGRLVPHLNLSSLIRLELDIVPCLKNLPLSSSILPLESLYLGGVEDAVRIAEFLERTPCLKILRMPWFPPSFDVGPSPLFELKPQVIPQLTELRASWSLCAQVLPGRPISRLEFSSMSGESGRNIVKTLASSTKSLVQLKVPISFYIDVPFWEHFPDLENLEIWSMDIKVAWGQSVSWAFQKWDRHPKLRFLGLEYHNTISLSEIDSEERHVLELLDATFPDLTRVEFSFRSSSASALFSKPYDLHFDTWSYTRVVGGSWHRTFRITHHGL